MKTIWTFGDTPDMMEVDKENSDGQNSSSSEPEIKKIVSTSSEESSPTLMKKPATSELKRSASTTTQDMELRLEDSPDEKRVPETQPYEPCIAMDGPIDSSSPLISGQGKTKTTLLDTEDVDLFDDDDDVEESGTNSVEELEISDKSKSVSCIVLDDSSIRSVEGFADHGIKMPSGDLTNDQSVTGTSPSSVSLFARAEAVPPKRALPRDSCESGTEEASKKMKVDEKKANFFTKIKDKSASAGSAADDEASGVPSVDHGSRPGSSLIAVDSPDISCSPIGHQGKEDLLKNLVRRTSTPGRKPESSSNSDEPAGSYRPILSPRKRKKVLEDSKKLTDIQETVEKSTEEFFKKPETSTSTSGAESPGQDHLIIAVVKSRELAKLKSNPDVTLHLVKSGSSHDIKELFNVSKMTAMKPAVNKRISDVSSISGTSGSSGYFGDIGSSASSGISGSQGSKRDRHSLMPELPVKPHNTIAPLPRPMPVEAKAQEPESKTDEVVIRKRKLRTKSERDSQRKKNEEELSEEIGIVSPIPDEAIEKAVSSKELKVGEKVLAKWIEKTKVSFWPGVIAEHEDAEVDEYYVKFDDGLEKKGLKHEDIIPLRCLAFGQQVNVCSENYDDGIFNIAILTSHPDYSNKNDVMFTVDYEQIPDLPQVESQMVSYKRIHLSNDQAKMIKQDLGGVWSTPSVSQTGANLSLDNLIMGKRRSRLATPKKLKDTPTKTPRRSKRGGAAVETSFHEEDEEETVKNPKARLSLKKCSSVKGKKVVADTTEEEFATPSKTRSRKKASKKTSSSESPPAEIFKGMTFVLTQGSHPPADDDLNNTMSALETETEPEAETAETSTPENKFNRKKLKQIIEDRGGEVLDEFPGSKKPISPKLMVISDRHYHTFSYLMAVGFNIPRVSYLWILYSADDNRLKIVDDYLLPIGFSKLEKRVVEQHETRSKSRKGVFHGQHLLVSSTKAEFGFDWKPLLTRMGALVSFRSQGKLDRSLKAVNVIIVDEQNPARSIVRDATEKAVPAVSASWVIESLIKGSCVPFKEFLLS